MAGPCRGFHVPCMGYEIAGGIGVRRGAPDRDVIIMVGDGSYLMMHTEIVTVVAERIKVIIVLVQNQGFASIGALSDTVGSQRYGTKYRYRDDAHNDFDEGEPLPVDLAANAASLGIDVIRVEPGPGAIDQLSAAMSRAKASDTATLIHIHSDPLLFSIDGGGRWDVPVAEVSTMATTTRARAEYERQQQRPLLG